MGSGCEVSTQHGTPAMYPSRSGKTAPSARSQSPPSLNPRRSPGRPPRDSRRLGNDRVVQSIYEAAGGEDGLLRLAKAWHARVMTDEVVSHAFSPGSPPQRSERLAAHWAEALGGPHTYSDRY